MLCPRIFTAKWQSLIPYSHLFLPSGRWSGVISAAYSSLARRSLLMNQFDKVKAQFADYIILFQVGDFYELYGEDASKLKLLTKYAPCIEHRAIFLSTSPPPWAKSSKLRACISKTYSLLHSVIITLAPKSCNASSNYTPPPPPPMNFSPISYLPAHALLVA